MRWLVGMLLLLAGCGPALVTYVPAGATAVDGRTRYLMVRHEGGSASFVEFDCEAAPPSAPGVACIERTLELTRPSAVRPRGAESEVVRAVAGCPADQIEIQSGDDEGGYWLWMCGRQRFFRRIDGTWTEQTP